MNDEKTCPQCAEQVKKAARVCKHCGFTFPEQPVAGTKSAGRKLGVGCLVAVVLVLSVAMCTSSGGDSSSSKPVAAITSASGDAAQAGADAAAAAAAAGAGAAPLIEAQRSQSKWYYHDEKDQLRNKTQKFAEIISNNEVNFGFPYGGGSRLKMTIRKSPKYGEDVIFQISDGQFICGLYNCAGAISFDGSAEKLTLTTAADNSSDVLFATYGASIIRKLKSSDKTIIELPFYQEGNRQFIFDTKDLHWPPKTH